MYNFKHAILKIDNRMAKKSQNVLNNQIVYKQKNHKRLNL